jgi:hypothetical protein
MSIRIESLGISKATIHADVFDSAGRRVRATATPTADGSVSFLINSPTPNSDYYVRVRAKNEPVRTGNYVTTVDFATSALGGTETREKVATGVAPRTRPTWSRFEVYKTQLFRFDLAAQASTNDSGVRITIYDAKRATVVFSMATAALSPEVTFAWLQRGVYAVRIDALGRSGTATAPVRYTLSATGISDDQGPLPVDPTDPYGGVTSIDPYGGPDPFVSPIPDPYGGANPFPFPDLTPGEPVPPVSEPPEPYDPWYVDPYYEYYYDTWPYG